MATVSCVKLTALNWTVLSAFAKFAGDGEGEGRGGEERTRQEKGDNAQLTFSSAQLDLSYGMALPTPRTTLLHHPHLDAPSQTSPEVCLIGDSRSC